MMRAFQEQDPRCYVQKNFPEYVYVGFCLGHFMVLYSNSGLEGYLRNYYWSSGFSECIDLSSFDEVRNFREKLVIVRKTLGDGLIAANEEEMWSNLDQACESFGVKRLDSVFDFNLECGFWSGLRVWLENESRGGPDLINFLGNQQQ